MGEIQLKNKICSFLLTALIAFNFISYIPPADAVIATGGTITYSGQYVIHTFTSSGNFIVTQGGNVDYLVIGGGGSGGNQYGGGGGAGQFLNGSGYAVTPQTYSITIGAGGVGVGAGNRGINGGNSTFDTIVATGGGGGSNDNLVGLSGGSGGGGGYSGASGGIANSGVGGNNGGIGAGSACFSGGGGGGAGAVGQSNPVSPTAANGGNGLSTSISGTSQYYAGGGGGAGGSGGQACSSGGTGGLGGGGDGLSTATSGTANTGGGGGGQANGVGGTSGTGGSGIVIIRYLNVTPPDRINDLTTANLGSTTVDLVWTQPNLNGGNLTNYLVNMTSPWGNPLTFKANTTNTYLNVTGLVFGTDYSARVSALTEGGYNATGNILNFTTGATSYSLPPVITKVFPNSYTSTTQLNIEWTASAMQNINGYKIYRQDDGGSWSCSVASCNTTSATTYFNNTGLTTDIIYNYKIYALNGTGLSTVSNEKSMTTFHLPDAIDDLTATASDFTTVALSWTAPTSYAPSITGYQVNYTTPAGIPLTIQTPSPYTTTTNAIIYGLTVGDDYSFRVSPITFHGKNASGNIVNVTTSNLFTPGEINPLVAANTADFKIFYERTDTNSTYSTLTVTYPDTYILNCNFQYQFSGVNSTYTGLTQTVVDDDDVSSSFAFVNPANDIINVRCYDTLTDDEAKYIMVISQFPFLDQIANMRNGTYGTYFQIGAIDGVTLMICILATLGFNRTNPVAGIMFLVITIGVLSWFEIITYPIVMYPALALLATWAFITTRKDD